MKVAIAFVLVVAIWSTTPLAIQWSGMDIGPLLGLLLRMASSFVLCALLMILLRLPFVRDKQAIYSYIVAGFGLSLAMAFVYLAAQRIPSGLIAVVFGLTPMMTGVFAYWWLQEKITYTMIGGMILGLVGLYIIFMPGKALSSVDQWGVGLIFMSTLLHSVSLVLMKKFSSHLNPLNSSTGGLLFALPVYVFLWVAMEGQIPQTIPMRPLLSILYLSVIGSVVGFSLFYFLLKNISAGKVSLITIFTPVIALWIGKNFNAEIIETKIMVGCNCILAGLILYQWGDLFFKKFRPGVNTENKADNNLPI